jgi:hypothetical protein
MITNHATKRLGQRCVPPIIEQWLDEFGDNQHDGNGAIKRYFSNSSIRRMQKVFGSQFVKYNRKWLNAYKVDSTADGSTITIGWITKRICK